MNAEDLSSRICAHLERNLALTEALRSKGVRFSAPRTIELEFRAPEQSAAAMLARALYENGFVILMLAPNDRDTAWTIEAATEEPLSTVVSLEFIDRMVRLAAAEFEGWGTRIPV